MKRQVIFTMMIALLLMIAVVFMNCPMTNAQFFSLYNNFPLFPQSIWNQSNYLTNNQSTLPYLYLSSSTFANPFTPLRWGLGYQPPYTVQPQPAPKKKAKNIIFMVPDGMGLSNVTAARIFQNGPDGPRLDFETVPQIGYQSTHALNSTVTDSAAAASAWACGEKFNNNEISCHAVNKVCIDRPETILEKAKQLGKATGLVATSTITHATPAVWGAHVHYRNCEIEIARQYIEEAEVDVLLGGGFGPNQSGKNCEQYPGQDKNTVIASAQSSGYTYVTTKSGMHAAATTGTTKILGLFTSAGKTPEMFRVQTSPYPVEEPTLAEMTTVALDILEDDREGFFAMIEGSQIDWANHANDPNYQIAEVLAFNEAFKVVKNWINAVPRRQEETLLIIVPDHDCGGYAVNGPYGALSKAGDVVEAGWTSLDHTAGDTIIWSQGPGSEKLGKAIDNTDIFYAMEEQL